MARFFQARSGLNRQMGYRTAHSIEILGDDLIIWGGDQNGLPLDHDSMKKRSITTNLDRLNIPTMRWNNVSTDGAPPAGAMDYSTATIGEEMYVFGGRCDSRSSGCVHNDLYQLNTTNRVWRSIPCTNRPMKKYSCGFISYSYQGSDYLLALGGVGGKQPPTEPQIHSLYTPSYGRYRTNEVHIMNITTSPGKWISPTVTGDRPPPISRFTIDQLPNNRSKAVLFGGVIVPKTNKSHHSNDIYTLSLTSDTVNFTKMSPQQHSTMWPTARYNHSSTIITNGTEDHLLIIGGRDDNGFTLLADCWALNITTKRWIQIDLPQSVCGRWHHSVSSVTMNTNTHWIIVTGGKWLGDITSSAIEGVDVTMIVELAYHDSQWMVRGVWNSTQKQQLLDRMKTILKALNQESHREIQQLRQKLQQKEGMVNELEDLVKRLTTELQTQLQQKDKDLQQTLANNEKVIQQKDADLQKKDEKLQQLTLQLQGLQNDIKEKDNIIRRNDSMIVEHQREISRYRDNPHWVIQEEVEITGPVLGRGGWGEVKEGVFRGTRVAVKTLHEIILSDYYLQLFSREMDIASRVRHPNLLQFIGATRVGNLMIVTELMPTSLRKELEKSPMTRPQVLSIGIDVASGLNYLHCWRPHPILHRDVSSANVLLEPSSNGRWKAKLSDYGSANLVENVQTANPGNPVYSPPEAINPTHHSPAMDVYSFGILMMEIATGQFPPSAQHERVALIRVVKWVALRNLIVRCTKLQSRPLTSTVLEQLKAMSIDEYNRKL